MVSSLTEKEVRPNVIAKGTAGVPPPPPPPHEETINRMAKYFIYFIENNYTYKLIKKNQKKEG